MTKPGNIEAEVVPQFLTKCKTFLQIIPLYIVVVIETWLEFIPIHIQMRLPAVKDVDKKKVFT